MTTFYTADLHFGHTNIIEYCNRPFNSVSHMNRALIENWNSVVGRKDKVIVVGDICMGKIDESLKLVRELNGKVFLVPGNHDRVFNHKHPRFNEWFTKYQDAGIKILPKNLDLENQGRIVRTTNHFPPEGDSHDADRYADHRPIDVGQWIIHGHTHGLWRTRGRWIDVGVDAWDYAPVSDDEIQAIMSGSSEQARVETGRNGLSGWG